MEPGPRQKKLIERLKTTDSVQIIGRLCLLMDEKPCYCAEGLICDLAIEMGCDIKKQRSGDHISFDHDSALMSPSVERFFKLHNCTPIWKLNDLECLSFKEIADRIEKNPDDFFCDTI